jgi:hypothetical protein
MVIKVDVMNTDQETIWYESLYVKLCWFKCIAMICGPVQVFQVVRLPNVRRNICRYNNVVVLAQPFNCQPGVRRLTKHTHCICRTEVELI